MRTGYSEDLRNRVLDFIFRHVTTQNIQILKYRFYTKIC